MNDQRSIQPEHRFETALIVISDRAHSGQREDLCEAAIRDFLATRGYLLGQVTVVPDEVERIREALMRLAETARPMLALTAGGTGVSPRDVTPEATRPLLEREIPGLPEAMRAASMKVTPYASLSRGLAGYIGPMLVINLPGSPKAAVENLASVFLAIEHAMAKSGGDMSDCQPPPS